MKFAVFGTIRVLRVACCVLLAVFANEVAAFLRTRLQQYQECCAIYKSISTTRLRGGASRYGGVYARLQIRWSAGRVLRLRPGPVLHGV
jgi:hypothetical protein